MSDPKSLVIVGRKLVEVDICHARCIGLENIRGTWPMKVLAAIYIEWQRPTEALVIRQRYLL